MVRDALYNSQQRVDEHASICHPDTRTRIISNIEEWASSSGHSVCWLRGPAGTGKSTIASTVAEHLEDNRLAATFFFSRKKGTREDITKLVPTLACQIAERIPSARRHMEEALRQNRSLLSLSLKDQFLKLIFQPLKNVIESSQRSLIVIDGLDECSARGKIVEMIRLFGETLSAHGHPIRFLLTSRPEPDIEAAFRRHLTSNASFWLALEDSRNDVRKYLQDHFRELRIKYNTIMVGEPMDWPPAKDLEDLVRRSEGLFIHAATLIQYMDDGRDTLQEKLRKVLDMHNGVDPLYAQIIAEARKENENFDQVMGWLMYLRYPISVTELAELLGLDVSSIRLALNRCHSVLVVPDSNDESIRPYHASLRDFLIDPERSIDCFCDPARFHALIAIRCLKVITDSHRSDRTPPKFACIGWYYHCCALVSGANASQSIQLLCHEIKTEYEKIDPDWLRFWIPWSLYWAGGRYIVVDLPPRKVSEQSSDCLR
jgi:NACHT domain